MEDGVLNVLEKAAASHGLGWEALWQRMKEEGRLHLETY
jgi:ferredoxin--NADP+ reductase/benzoyl-CoA 2,3-dioxygenase component A